MLNGTYYFREVAYEIGDEYGDFADAAALYNTISFDGNGHYTITNAAYLDASSGSELYSTTGTYSIAASGFGFLSSPLVSGASVYGLVAQNGVFVGSSTESGFNDLFIAAPVASPQATNATLKGTYTIADLDVTLAIEEYDYNGYGVDYVLGAMFQVNPDGAGNLGAFVVDGYLGGGGSTLYTQTVSSQKYNFTNGAASFTIPSSNSAIVSGQKFVYISPDGNFIFGGGTQAWDFFVGVRTGTTTPNLNGLYYQAGIDEDESVVNTDGYGLLDTYFGSFSASNGTLVGHQRQTDVLFSNPVTGFTYADTYTIPSNGAYTDSEFDMKYAVGANGAVRIGSGIGPYLALSVALQAPQASGTGVWIDPQGVVNAGSFAPFTSGVSPGELITIFGNNLAPSTTVASSIPFPTNLNGVQVTVNGTSAPIYYVTPGQISVLVPFEIAGGTIANISVNNNGTTSNTVTEPINLTTPGVLTQTQNGLGNGSILHAANYSLVTSASPAQAGETVALYLTGLGAISPTVPDGSEGPTSTLSQPTNTIAVDLSGTTATASSYLAPGLAGLYQINVTIPTGLTSGNNVLDIEGPDSYASEAVIPVGTGGATTTVEPAVAEPASGHRKLKPAEKPALRRAPVCLRLEGCPGKQ
jgi:uncharacterized protein (TIGR03437 family)